MATRALGALRHLQGSGHVIVVLALVLALLGVMAAEPTRKLVEQRALIDDMVHDLQSVKEGNRNLKRRVERLQDPDFVEQRARSEMGLVRPGEVSYVVIPGKRSKRTGSRQPEPPAPARPGALEGWLDFLGLP